MKSKFNHQTDTFGVDENRLPEIESQLQGHESTVQPDDKRIKSRERKQCDSRPLPETNSEQSILANQIVGLKGNFFDQRVENESIFKDSIQSIIEQDQFEQMLEELRAPLQLKDKQEAPQEIKNAIMKRNTRISLSNSTN